AVHRAHPSCGAAGPARLPPRSLPRERRDEAFLPPVRPAPAVTGDDEGRLLCLGAGEDGERGGEQGGEREGTFHVQASVDIWLLLVSRTRLVGNGEHRIRVFRSVTRSALPASGSPDRSPRGTTRTGRP